MAKHLVFLRWWLILIFSMIGFYFSYSLGAIDEIRRQDYTHICEGVIVAFWGMSIWCGYKTWVFSKKLIETSGLDYADTIDRIKNQERIGWFAADTFTALGFLGTVVGMVYALQGFINLDPNNAGAMQGLISQMVQGMSTALYTTIVGLIAARVLMLQYYNLGHSIRKVDR